jgi:hypothetical protein
MFCNHICLFFLPVGQGGSITIRVGGYKVRGTIKAAGFSIHRNGQKATEYDMSLLSTETCVAPLFYPLIPHVSSGLTDLPQTTRTLIKLRACSTSLLSALLTWLRCAQVLPHVGARADGHR